MQAGFVIFNIDVTNPEDYNEYITKVKPIVEKFGGEYVVRGGTNQVVEGNWQYSRTIVLKFPSYEKALEWYNSDLYKPVKELRQKNSEGNLIIIKGV